ncbi:hypothetical protein [Comamonas kerstersii]
MNYEAWRISFQTSEQAARAAYTNWMRAEELLTKANATSQPNAESQKNHCTLCEKDGGYYYGRTGYEVCCASQPNREAA